MTRQESFPEPKFRLRVELEGRAAERLTGAGLYLHPKFESPGGTALLSVAAPGANDWPEPLKLEPVIENEFFLGYLADGEICYFSVFVGADKRRHLYGWIMLARHQEFDSVILASEIDS